MVERPGLSRQRIVEAAVAVADRGGVVAVSMRNVGRELGVEAMSLYHHIANKEALLDELADWVFTGFATPEVGAPWRAEMARRAATARAVLGAHPWALGLIESRRTPGPALLRHHDAVLGCLRADGFSLALAGHAFSVLDAYVQGFVLTETTIPLQPDVHVEELTAGMDVPVERYPHLVAFMSEVVLGEGYSFAAEFEHGLELVLDGLEVRLSRSPASGDEEV